jgi:Signal transduction histidine kinase regulating citrate/malate metabolism
MIHNNLPLVLCIALVMCFQIRLFFNSVLDQSARKPNRFVYFALFVLLAFVYLTVFITSLVSSILALAMIFVLAQAYRVELKTKIIFTVLYGVLMTIVNFISLYIIYAIDSVDLAAIDFASVQARDQLPFTKAALLSCIIMFVVIQIIRLIARRRSFSIHYRYYILFMIVPLISIYQLNVLTSYGEKNIHYFISIMGFLFINVGIVYILDHLIDKFQFMHENAQLQKQMDYQDANYEKTVHSFKSIKRIIHDTNQQFLYIEECINRNELAAAREHIKATLNKVEGAYHRVNTGNLVIDALVTNTLNIGQANGIRIDTKLSLNGQQLTMDRYDLCVVLGNMLDNAIEASKKVKVAEDRYMVIKIHADESTLLIHVHNHMENEVAQLQSQKPNPEYHGIGLTNISRICEKYGGNMTIEAKHRTFHNMVIIPI